VPAPLAYRGLLFGLHFYSDCRLAGSLVHREFKHAVFECGGAASRINLEGQFDCATELPRASVLVDRLLRLLLGLEPDFVYGGWESNFSADGAGDRAALQNLGITTYVSPAACKEAGYMPDPLTFDEVFETELEEIEKRWDLVYPDGSRRRNMNSLVNAKPATEHGLVGIGFSGGGIRSAVFNLGVAQALCQYGAFEHLDYMSTVSGGGYLGSSISTLMRSRAKSEVAGTVKVAAQNGQTVVFVKPEDAGKTQRTYRFPVDTTLVVEDGQHIEAGQPLVKLRAAWGKSDFDGTVTAVERGGSTPMRLMISSSSVGVG